MLHAELEKAGFSVFRDEDAIRVGDNWLERLQTALQACSAFVLLAGREGIRRWVGAEVQYALIRHLSPHDEPERLPIFPVLLPEGDAKQLPAFLLPIQFQRWQPGEPLSDKLIQAIRARAPIVELRATLTGCPFLGLGTFQPEHAPLFFGRRKETLEALKFFGSQQSNTHPDRIRIDSYYGRWLQIEGNSGAGKSSLVNAGLLPLIGQGTLWARTGFEKWQILGPMMPGKQPLKQLAVVLEHAFESDPARRNSLRLQQRMESDPRALAYFLSDRKQVNTAFLLVVDQFEELFTFSNKVEKWYFDAQLAYALSDNDCPLFLISTVRIDFLEGFEQLTMLSELYNQHCKRYLLKIISPDSLREVIEQPAQLVGLDVNEVTTAILNDARDEPGALPLVENALRVLWDAADRDGKKYLSGKLYHARGGIAGLLEEEADRLLYRLENDLKGREDALELLLALTRISDEGRHTRRRLPLEEARLVAGGIKVDPQRGRKIIDYLTGRIPSEGTNCKNNSNLRLLTTVGDHEDDQSIDLIHETLIRARGKDETTGKLVGYWKTLYDYIDKNRDRSFYRDQLTQKAKEWQSSRGWKRWWKLAGWGDLNHYRKLRPAQGSMDAQFLRQSRRVAWLKGSILAVLFIFTSESYLWTLRYGFPPSYMLIQQKFRLIDLGVLPMPLPEMSKEIQPPAEGFWIGEYDKEFGESKNKQLKQQGAYGQQNFGYPGKRAVILQPFSIGKYEVTYEEYDYYVWQQQKIIKTLEYPNGAPGNNERGPLAVVNVSWQDANTYLLWLSEKTGEHFRLPTEAEWEYAARGQSTTPYWWGQEVGVGMANCNGCGSQWDNKLVAPVGSFKPNAFGLYDTAGNVWEWTCSEWKIEFDGSESHCIYSGETSGGRALRGGSWDFDTNWLHSSARSRDYPIERYSHDGFRVVRTAKAK